MASFAPGTNPSYANAYSNWWLGQQGNGPAPQRSTFGPDAGQAQPVPPQSQGTPYGSPAVRPGDPRTGNPSLPPPTTGGPLPPAGQSQDFSAYRPQQTPAAQPAYGNPFAQYNPQQMGNFVQQQMGLPSFQFTATDAFGKTFDNPAALTAQQGAMAQALNAQRAQQIQSGQRAPLNPQAAYQQAQQMIQDGWTNPFAMPDSQQMGTMGGPATDPRWSHNGGQWQSGQAQPVQPPSQGTPYGQGQGGYPPLVAPDRNIDWRMPPRPELPFPAAGGPIPYDQAQGDGQPLIAPDRNIDWRNPRLSPQAAGGPFPAIPQGGARTMDFRDRDGDGVDDRDAQPLMDRSISASGSARPAAPPSPVAPYSQPAGGGGARNRSIMSSHTKLPQTAAPERRAGAAQPVPPPSQGTRYGYDLGNDTAGGPYAPGAGYRYEQPRQAPAIPAYQANDPNRDRYLTAEQVSQLPFNAAVPSGATVFRNKDNTLLVRDASGKNIAQYGADGSVVREFVPNGARTAYDPNALGEPLTNTSRFGWNLSALPQHIPGGGRAYPIGDDNYLIRDENGRDLGIRHGPTGRLVRDLRSKPPSRNEYARELRSKYPNIDSRTFAQAMASRLGTEEPWEYRDPWTGKVTKGLATP